MASFPEMDKPKKKPSLLLGVEEGKPSSDDATTDEDESAEDSTAAAGEVFDALKTEDREGFATALKAFVMTCK